MQKMAEGDGDTHDHGPPKDTLQHTKNALRHHTPFPRVAVWSTKMSSAGVNSFSGAMAGMASGIVTCPLDVIKTKLQAQKGLSPTLHGGQMYRGMLGTAREILKDDGVKGFYRGLGPMLLGYLPTWAVYMAVYDSSRDYFYAHGFSELERDKWLARIYASVTAGACSTLATNPIWVIKTRLMAQKAMRDVKDAGRNPWYYQSTLDAARKMYASEGMAAFYSGLTPALLGLTHVAIQFPLYEYFKQQFTGLEMGESPASSGSEGKNTLGILAATFLSKVCATSATYPHEVLRTRMQTQTRTSVPESSANGVATNHHSQALPRNGGKRIGNTDGVAYERRYKGVVRTCRTILQKEGWRAFYNGMGTNMIRAVPAAMTTMLTFESIKGAIGKMQEEGREIMRDENGVQ